MISALVPALTPTLAPTLLQAALRALLVAFTVWAGLRLFGVRNVLAQKAAWGLVLAAALAMDLGMRWQLLPAWAAIRLPGNPWTKLATPQQEEPTAPSPAPAAASLREVTQAPEAAPAGRDRFPAPRLSQSNLDASNRDQFPAPSSPHHFVPLSEETSPPATPPAFPVARAAWLVYLAVCALLLIRMFYGLLVSLRLWRHARPVYLPGEGLVARLAAGIPLRASSRVASPVTIGSGIILPADYAGWDAEKLRIVLAHERSHIRQGDFYLQLLAGLHASLFWFSPLGWWLKRKLSELAETISDRAGLEEAASRSSYAQILLEFAALPRPTPIGVAMARTSILSHRIERLLDDSSFRQAFAGSRGRALLAVLLVPAALFAATALIRVQAAAAAPAVQAATQAPTATGTSTPDQAPDQAQDQAPAAPESPTPAIAPAPAPALAVAPPSAPAQAIAPEPPVPPEPMDQDKQIIIRKEIRQDQHRDIRIVRKEKVIDDGRGSGHGKGQGYSYSYSSNGETYALVSGPGADITFSGDWNQGHSEEIKKASRMAHGKFLWFLRNGKSYIVEDPAMLAQIEALDSQMTELGRQQEALGREQEKLEEKQGELGRQQEQASIPTPNISNEMAKLNEAAAKLQAKIGKTVTQEELADLEGQLGEIQGKLGELQGEIGAKQGHLGGLQGRLGAEQGRLAREAGRKVKEIIDESLKNGKARPVN